ncbi:MAG: hypothetical protein ABJE95_25920 [Byssovorax sp.]
MRSPPVTALILGALLPACGGAPPAPPPKVTSHALCDGAHLDACERRLVAPESANLHAIALDYAAARADRDGADPWAAVFRELDRGPHPAAAIVADRGAAIDAAKLGEAARVVVAAALPKPAALDEEALLIALADAAGYRHVIRIHASPAAVLQLFPRDPLAPFASGLAPVVRDDAALAHLGDDVALAAAIDEAFAAAGAFRYVDAARAADRIEALLASRDPLAETSLRARYARQLLGNAGILLDAADPGDPRPAATIPEAPAPARHDTPYGDLLRVHLATSASLEWDRRGATILAAIAEDRRADFASLWTTPRGCDADRGPPPMEGRRDLVFAHRLSGALIRDDASLKRGAAGGFLPLPAWLARYRTLVQLVDDARVGWSYAPTILLQRGEAFGLDPAGSELYRRVTALGKAHLDATRALEQSAPTRYRALSQIAFAASPGVLFDDRLREPLIQLTAATVKDRLAAAHDPSAIFAGVLTGAFAGVSYPPAVQEAHFAALQGAFTAKLQGDLHHTTGWSTAGLHALDAAYRIVADQKPKLDVASAEIARALADPALPYPALGALAVAAAQYAALAATHRLDPDLHPVARFPADRRAARDTLRAALAGLGAPGEAPNNVLDDVTDLADGLVATLSTAIGERPTEPEATPKPGKTKRGSRIATATAAPAASVCASKATVVLTPATRRALARLGDVRLRIVGHPRFKQGDGLWVRRVRLLVTVLSDAMDIALKDDKRLAFTIAPEAAEKAAADALREWDDRPAADLVAGAYALAREVATADTKERFLTRSGRPVQRVLTGLATLFRGDPGGASGAGVALLDAFARLGVGADPGKGLDAMLVSYASAFYAGGRADQGDLALLGAMAVAALTQGPPSPEAIALAAQHRSRITWALRFLAELHATSRHLAPDPTVYEGEMRAATDDACQLPAAEGTLAVARAVHDFAAGRRSEARAALDAFLDHAEAEGLRVPRMAYRYEEKTATKVFALTLEVSYGAGMLQGSNTFQLGLGIRSPGDPEGSLTAALAPPDSAKSDEEAARYYVHAAALAAVYHLLEGDEARATTAARRAVAALTAGARLGPRALRTDRHAALGVDARAALAVAAQLAAEAGMPFLAGDLWTIVRQGLPESADDAAIAGVLDPVPFGLTGSADLDAAIARTRKSLRAVADPLACTRAKVELGAYEEPACDAYPLALSLRIADVLKKLPRLRRGDPGARCAPLRSLDAFLGGVEKGAYDPDTFARAVSDLRAAGHLYDAATLLARQRREGHCGPQILAATRALGRSTALGPLVRADLLSVAVNCTAAVGGPEVAADLLALDAATRALADPARSLKVLLSVADLAARTDQWALLDQLVIQPDFLDRWSAVHPTAAAAALLFAHASAVVAGRAIDLDKTRAAYDLACTLYPPGDRAEVCADLLALRASPAGAPADRRRAAQEAVQRRIAAFTTPATPGSKPPR